MRHLTLAALLVLAGCSVPPEETPEEARARRTADCRTAGFAPDSPELRLCLLLQQANERLDAVDLRLRRIEQDVQFPGAYGGYRGRYWW